MDEKFNKYDMTQLTIQTVAILEECYRQCH